MIATHSHAISRLEQTTAEMPLNSDISQAVHPCDGTINRLAAAAMGIGFSIVLFVAEAMMGNISEDSETLILNEVPDLALPPPTIKKLTIANVPPELDQPSTPELDAPKVEISLTPVDVTLLVGTGSDTPFSFGLPELATNVGDFDPLQLVDFDTLDHPPRIAFQPDIRIPRSLVRHLEATRESTALIQLIIATDGTVESIDRIDAPHPALGSFLRSKLSAIRFEPGTVKDESVRFRIQLPFLLPAK